MVQRGRRGSRWLAGGRYIAAPAPRVRAVDTTGAGDAFNGALACELASGAALADAVRAAIAVASQATLGAGARTVPHRAG